MKLTPIQRKALSKLRDGDKSAYGLRVSLSTLQTLQSKGLVRAVGVGHTAMPTSAQWQITEAGRTA